MERTSLIKLDKNIIKETSLLAFPIIIQGLVYELQSLTDKAFLGHLKTEYVSAIGAAQLPLNATMDGLVALSVAITIIVSHLYGAKKQEEAINYVKSAMLYSDLLSVSVCFLWEFFTYPILHFFKVAPQIISHSVDYVKICALFFLVIGIDSSLNAMLQGLGKTKIIMYSGIIKVFFNIFLSWVLIFGKFGFKEYHVAGAAIGTLISNCFAFGFVLSYCFIKRKELGFGKFRPEDFSITYYSKVIKVGAPAGIEYLLWNFSNLILVRFINEFSYISMSIYTVTFGIQCIVYAVFANYSKAALTLIGHSLGARNYKKANDVFYNCLIINILIILCANVVFFLFTEDILSVFLKESYVVAQGDKYLKLIGLTMLPQSLNVVCGHAIKGNGNTKWMLLSQILGSIFVISLSFILIRGFHMDMVAIYLVIILDETIRGITNYIYYKRKYLNARIPDEMMNEYRRD